MACELCEELGGELVLASPKLRVIHVQDALHPAFYRVVWQAHVREMTDLSPVDRAYFMETVFSVETALRAVLNPLKINLASLGNVTPHLHWHVIARFEGDPHFPAPIWSEAKGLAPVQLPAGWMQLVNEHLRQHAPQAPQ